MNIEVTLRIGLQNTEHVFYEDGCINFKKENPPLRRIIVINIRKV